MEELLTDKETLRKELEALQIALKTEQDGFDYYTESSNRTRHPVAKKFFQRIAEEEKVHIRLIKAFYDELKRTEGRSADVPIPPPPKDYHERMKTIFQEALKDIEKHVPPETGILDVYRKSMELESKAAEFYKVRRDSTPWETVKRFYDWLFHFENDHYRMFSESLAYLENPEQWYQDYEKSIFEG
jgi:rubrerythrin